MTADQTMNGKDLGNLLIAHAERLWEAEREIADRCSSRVRLLVTLAGTLIGGQFIALVKAMSDLSQSSLGGVWSVLVALPLVVAVGISVWKMLETLVFLLYSMRPPVEAADLHREDRRRSLEEEGGSLPAVPQTASYELDLPEEFLTWSMGHSSQPEAIVFSQIAHAANDLRRRNLRERYRIQAAERSLVWGLRSMLVFVLALVVYFALLLGLR